MATALNGLNENPPLASNAWAWASKTMDDPRQTTPDVFSSGDRAGSLSRSCSRVISSNPFPRWCIKHGTLSMEKCWLEVGWSVIFLYVNLLVDTGCMGGTIKLLWVWHRVLFFVEKLVGFRWNLMGRGIIERLEILEGIAKCVSFMARQKRKFDEDER